MKKFLLFVLISIPVCAQTVPDIDSCAKSMRFEYKIPANCRSVPVVEQEDVLYQSAFINEDNIEYRIAAFDIKSIPPMSVRDIDGLRKTLYTMMCTIAFNISQDDSKEPMFRFFSDADVKREFGGDIGATCVAKGNSGFSKGYNFVIINSFFKENRGVIFTFILMNDVKKYLDASMQGKYMDEYYCVKFR
jgi:hypothetical protein